MFRLNTCLKCSQSLLTFYHQPLRQVFVPRLQPGLCSGLHEEPRSCSEAPPGRPAGSGPAEGSPPLEGAGLQKRIYPGKPSAGRHHHPGSRSGRDSHHSPPQGTDISSGQHRGMILWLGEMSRLFRFCPDTSALGVCILNRLLSTVKVGGLGVPGAFKHPWLGETRARHTCNANTETTTSSSSAGLN